MAYEPEFASQASRPSRGRAEAPRQTRVAGAQPERHRSEAGRRAADRTPPKAPAAGVGPPDNRSLSSYYVSNFFGEERARTLLMGAGTVKGTEPLPATIAKLDFWRLLLTNINLTDDEGHGCTPDRLPKSSFSVIFAAVNQMDTLLEGLERYAELIPVLRTGIVVSVGHGSDGVHLNFDFPGESEAMAERRERYLELIAMVFHCVLLWETAEDLRPVRVRLSSRLSDRDGSMVSGLAANQTRSGFGLTIVYDKADLATPLGRRKYTRWGAHDLTAFEGLMERTISHTSPPTSPTVEKLAHLLGNGDLSRPDAAKALGMSPATLQRRLSLAGTSFRELSKDIRRRKLVSLLSTDGRLDDIAAELGWSDRRSLWRSCHEWLGASPSQYRAGLRSSPS